MTDNSNQHPARAFASRTLSFVVPVKDEASSLAELVDRIARSCASVPTCSDFEILFIDDGSSDGSWDVIVKLSEQRPAQVRAFRLRRNFGKSIALEVGFKAACGDVIFTLDADLQDDPDEIPRFIAALDEGYDLVSGWKRDRHDPLSKTLPSKLFNATTAAVTGVKLHDFNCGFKAYRREVIERLRLYGELHRYVPVFANDIGFRVGEIAVRHHPRVHGKSKYGIERYVRGFLDLITILATTRYLQRPGHLFGGIGVTMGFIGTIILIGLTVSWFFGQSIGDRPMLFLGILLIIVSVQMISLGVIAELLIRITNPRDISNLVTEELSPDNGIAPTMSHTT